MDSELEEKLKGWIKKVLDDHSLKVRNRETWEHVDATYSNVRHISDIVPNIK